MKKYITLFCLLLIITTLSSCTLLIGGTNERELGKFVPVYTDSTNDYFEYSLKFDKGLVVKSYDDSYSLSELSTEDEALSVKSAETQVVLEAYISVLNGGAICAEGYEYVYDALDVRFDISDDDVFSEVLVLEDSGKIYGALNFYSRPSGRSGSLLTNENIVNCVYVSITDDAVVAMEKLENTAILAFNQTHIIIYRDKKVYSVDINGGEETFLFKDKWWDRGPSYYNDFRVSFTDESFLIYAKDDNGYVQKETLMAGGLDGTDFTTLIDNREIEY